MKRILLTGLGMIAAATTASAEIIDGRWTVLGVPCGQDPTLILTVNTFAGELHYWETRCIVTADAPVGLEAMAWNLTLICSGEGETWERKTLLAVAQPLGPGADVMFELLYEDGYVIGRERCPE